MKSDIGPLAKNSVTLADTPSNAYRKVTELDKLGDYYRRILGMEEEAIEIRCEMLRSIWTTGKILAGLKRNERQRTDLLPATVAASSEYRSEIDAAGLKERTARLYQSLTRLSEDEVEKFIQASLIKDPAEDKRYTALSFRNFLKLVADKDQDAKDAKAQLLADEIKGEGESFVYHGDSFELAEMIPDESCQLIFCDPPYDRKSAYLYVKTAELAARILVDGGSLMTYSGQINLPELLELVGEVEGLRYFWTIACRHSGSANFMREYGIRVEWKPVVWFVKGKFRNHRERIVRDMISGGMEKDEHEWQQAQGEAAYAIDAMTSIGDLVVDPFCGGGTTAVAAKSLDRRWWTADIDAAAVKRARDRINGI